MEVIIEKESDGSYIAYNTTGDFVVLLGTGLTVAETEDDFRESYRVVKGDYQERGDFMPPELTEEINFHLDF